VEGRCQDGAPAALIETIEQSDTLDQLAALEAPILGEELLGDPCL
jgi:hypothetical protein